MPRIKKPMIEDAILLATKLHKGQVDKIGEPYILHPLAVMLGGKNEKERIVGILHDVLEDCVITKVDLRKLGYSAEILEALDLLTKRPEEEKDYSAFIDRIVKSRNKLALVVKMRDIENNMEPSRFPTNPTEKDFSRQEKYKKALGELKPKKLKEEGKKLESSFWGSEIPESGGGDDWYH